MRFKESGPVPTNDSYLISNSDYTINLLANLSLDIVLSSDGMV